MSGMELWVCNLGRLEYGDAVALQERIRARVQAGELPGVLLLLEHPPVYTRGRRSDAGELPMGEAWYRAQGIDVVQTDRGGKLTYHGPGQLVGYPIMRVGDVPAFVARMERAITDALAETGVQARGRSADGREYTGVWAGDRKIASIGVHISRGVLTTSMPWARHQSSPIARSPGSERRPSVYTGSCSSSSMTSSSSPACTRARSRSWISTPFS